MKYSIKKQFRANIYAHAASFLINITAYGFTQNFFFIWVELASLCFIGYNNTKSDKFFDRNILQHFITVICFYLLAHFFVHNEALYVILIFSFTYVFFILKDNGYTKSTPLWMYIQALLIGTTFITFPFHEKILATALGYIEAQLLLNLLLLIYQNTQPHTTDDSYKNILKLPLNKWFNFNSPPVQLAIRGSITASLLYALCLNMQDIKPNWAVAVAISCIQRDDLTGSIRAIKGIIIGSLIGWPLSLIIIAIVGAHLVTATLILWLLIIGIFIIAFEHLLNPTLKKQIILTIMILAATTCVAIGVGLKSVSYYYANLKAFNSIAGAFAALMAVMLWQYSQHQIAKNK